MRTLLKGTRRVRAREPRRPIPSQGGSHGRPGQGLTPSRPTPFLSGPRACLVGTDVRQDRSSPQPCQQRWLHGDGFCSAPGLNSVAFIHAGRVSREGRPRPSASRCPWPGMPREHKATRDTASPEEDGAGLNGPKRRPRGRPEKFTLLRGKVSFHTSPSSHTGRAVRLSAPRTLRPGVGKPWHPGPLPRHA